MELFDSVKKQEAEKKQNANDVMDTCPAAPAKVKEVELDYATAYKLRGMIFDPSRMGRIFSIDAHRYKYQVYLLVDGVEINAREAMLSENSFCVPTRCFGCRNTYDYEQYHVCPGPYEHDYNLPVKFIDKVIIRIEAC